MTSPKTWRSDGEQARRRLLLAALECFVAHGYSKASVRDIAERAQVNIAAIRYYFGDKAGLYRALFSDPELHPSLSAEGDVQALPADISGAIRQLVQGLVEPLKAGEVARLCVRLYYREMLEPSGVWQGQSCCQGQMQVAYASLMQALTLHLGIPEDDDLSALVFDILGMGAMLYMGADVIQAIRPQLLQGDAALDRYQERLTGYALALVDAEARRRGVDVSPLSYTSLRS